MPTKNQMLPKPTASLTHGTIIAKKDKHSKYYIDALPHNKIQQVFLVSSSIEYGQILTGNMLLIQIWLQIFYAK